MGNRAVFAFYVSVISYLVATIAIDYWLRMSGLGAGSGGRGVTWLTAINPFLAVEALLDPSGYPRAEGLGRGLRSWFFEYPVVTWCIGSGALSLVLIFLSAITVRFGGLSSVARGGGVPWYRRMFGLGAAGAEQRPARSVWPNPIAWREAAARNSTLGRILARWFFILSGSAWGIAIVVMYHRKSISANEFQLALLATAIGEITVMTLVAINMAATAISREREDGTLDLLLTTPITPGQYLSGKLRGLVAYLLPLVAVPVGTLGLAGLYVLTDGFGFATNAGVVVNHPFTPINASSPILVPLVLPEAGLLAPLVLIPFMAFVVMIGLQWSLRSKGTLASVVSTVGVVGIASGAIGLCAWQAGPSVPVLGPVLAALSPASLFQSIIPPAEGFSETVNKEGGLDGARIAIAIGAIVAAGVYAGIVYGIHASLVRTFDFTVRKLAGQR